MIAHPIDDETDLNIVSNALSRVRKQLIDNDVSIEELLRNAGVNETHYNNALRVSSKGNSIVLKRNPNECKINNYNPNVI